MDAKVVAERKGKASARIDLALDVLIHAHGFSLGAVEQIKKKGTNELNDLYRTEAIADLMEHLLKLAEQKKKDSLVSSVYLARAETGAYPEKASVPPGARGLPAPVKKQGKG